MLNNFVRFKCTNGTVFNDVRCGLLIALLHIAEGILFAKEKNKEAFILICYDNIRRYIRVKNFLTNKYNSE